MRMSVKLQTEKAFYHGFPLDYGGNYEINDYSMQVRGHWYEDRDYDVEKGRWIIKERKIDQITITFTPRDEKVTPFKEGVVNLTPKAAISLASMLLSVVAMRRKIVKTKIKEE